MSGEMDEIWALYADDGAQAMDALEAALLALQQGGGDQGAHVGAMFRAVHTFKGNSRVLGLSVVESRAHCAEDLIGLVRDSGVPLDDEILTLLLEVGDSLRDMLDITAATRADVDPAASEGLMARLQDKIARCSDPAAGAAVAAGNGDHGGAAEGLPDVLTEVPTDTFAETYSGPRPDEDAFDTPQDLAADAPLDAHLEDIAEWDAPRDADLETPDTAAPAARLGDDPAYRAIFQGMVEDTQRNLRGLLPDGPFDRAAKILDDLGHAARQLGLTEWIALLDDAPAAFDGAAVETMLARLDGVQNTPRAVDGGDAAAPASEPHFLDIVSAPLSALAQMGIDFASGIPPAPDRLSETLEAIATAAEAHGFVSVLATCDLFRGARSAPAFRRAELRLYEEFTAIEALSSDEATTGFSPRSILDSWCADHIFDTLAELDVVLEQMRAGRDLEDAQTALERLTRLVLHACRHYELDMAAQLAMSLLDLFARAYAQGVEPDAILMRFARGFVDTLELVFDALREGDPPDTERLERLFAEAAEASYRGTGLMTASAVERQLGLPPEFHAVLSPESVRSASEALAEGHNFFILRADVNGDDTMAEAFFEFIGSGQITPITNVTVFRGDDTLFDFLVATRLDPMDLAEAVLRMNPDGTKLSVLRHLQPLAEADPLAASDPESAHGGADAVSGPVAGVELSAAILEQIGELAAGQAMVHGILTELAEVDLVEKLSSILRAQEKNPRQASDMADALALHMAQRLQELMQIETQLLTQLSELQQSTAELRARPLETVLRPLIALASTRARQLGNDLRVTTTGAENSYDLALLENLKRVLRALIMMRVDCASDAPGKIHISVLRSDDKLSVTIEDDGAAPPPETEMATAKAEIIRLGGALRAVHPPGGGLRFHLDLPISLVVMEGMVVGSGGARFVLPVESIRTILQPDASHFVQFSVQGRQNWLRLNAEEMIALRPLSRIDRATAEDRNPSLVVILGQEGNCVAVPVDEVVGQQLVLLRPLRGVLSQIRGAMGVALLAGGEVGTVLSARALCDRSGTETAALVH